MAYTFTYRDKNLHRASHIVGAEDTFVKNYIRRKLKILGFIVSSQPLTDITVYPYSHSIGI